MLDVTDPNILVVYHSVVHNESLNWLLLNYSSDVLKLCASGTQGILEMRDQIMALEDVFFGFCRETFDGQARYVLINYVPEWTSSKRRATVTAHLHYVTALFEAEEAVLVVSCAENLSLDLVRDSLPPSLPPRHSQRSPFGKVFSRDHATDERQYIHVRRPGSDSTSQSQTPPVSKSGLFSHFLRRKKWEQGEKDSPPPPPPKDESTSKGASATDVSDASLTDESVTERAMRRGRSISLGATSNQPDGVHLTHASTKFVRAQLQNSHLRVKWALSENLNGKGPIDPKEKALRRAETQRKREQEEQAAIKEEEDRQARRQEEKAALKRQEAEDEMRRKAQLEAELRRASAEKTKRERQAKEEEERKAKELDDRKRADRERRLQEGRKVEEWRREKQRLADEALRRKEDAQRQAEEDRLARIHIVKAKLKRRGNAEALMMGWVTVQTNESLTWRRRWFTFEGSNMLFYRSPQDMTQVLDTLELRGHVQALREWYEGYEDLEAIPHSFAVELADGQGAWSMFADSAEEKIELLGFLHQAAQL